MVESSAGFFVNCHRKYMKIGPPWCVYMAEFQPSTIHHWLHCITLSTCLEILAVMNRRLGGHGFLLLDVSFVLYLGSSIKKEEWNANICHFDDPWDFGNQAIFWVNVDNWNTVTCGMYFLLAYFWTVALIECCSWITLICNSFCQVISGMKQVSSLP